MNAQEYRLAEEEEIEGGGEKRRTMNFIRDGLPHGSRESFGKREDRVGKGMNRREKSEENTKKKVILLKMNQLNWCEFEGYISPIPS